MTVKNASLNAWPVYPPCEVLTDCDDGFDTMYNTWLPPTKRTGDDAEIEIDLGEEVMIDEVHLKNSELDFGWWATKNFSIWTKG